MHSSPVHRRALARCPSALIYLGLLLAAGCGDPAPGSSPAASPAGDPAGDQEQAAPEVEAEEPLEPEVATEDWSAEEADQTLVEQAGEQRRTRARKLFGEVIGPLTEAAEAHSEHDQLEESTWVGKDQKDNLEDINSLLDGVIEALDESEVATTRAELRQLEGEIRVLNQRLIDDREKRLSAPTREELNRIEKVYTKSREEYDERIQESLDGIAERRAQIQALHEYFVQQMRGLGLDIDLEGARSLLATVTGDDFVAMCVVLDNVRGLTLQLQELTDESGESLEAARRYYGAYVMLVRLMDRVQKSFITRALDEMLPKLDQLADQAEGLIEQAEENIEAGGNRAILEQNIESNELTVRATTFYGEYLRGQAAEIQARNDKLQVSLRDAENTFDTVSLSSQVAAILQEGQRNFAALLSLELPPLRGFDNAELQQEFERLTQEMSGIQ